MVKESPLQLRTRESTMNFLQFLQKTNMFRDARPLAKERMDALAEAAAAAVSNVRIG